ncbi:tetrahydrofolate synthase [Spizellomyces sp. 'palustris']|nr:tetrahydrofolate synthase [Spizellomyces sp. 'palustris']
MSLSEDKSYEAAVTTLNNLQTNARLLEVLRKAGNSMNYRSIPEMRRFVERIGYKVHEFNKLNAIHVAGTKGKGSTSAICDAILRNVQITENNITRPLKTGLFTSPHLIEVRERIRINGKPIEKHLFAKYFFEVWDALEKTKPEGTDEPDKPQYFRYLTLMAFHTFMREGVDVVLLEVGMGGQYDATSVIEKPTVCGITSLGFDHMPLLGKTLPEIAWHKAGIMKVPREDYVAAEEAMPVLRERAKELKASSLVEISSTEIAAMGNRQLGMSGAYQWVNAALAVALCEEWIAQRRSAGVPIVGGDDAVKNGLRVAKWPGRAQKFVASDYPSITWYLDGAHTKESMRVCADWFNDEYRETEAEGGHGQQVLLFNCTKGRDGLTLLKALVELHKSSVPFSRVVFCTNDSYRPGSGQTKTDQTNYTVLPDDELSIQKELADAWKTLIGSDTGVNGVVAEIEIQPSIEDAVESISRYYSKVQAVHPRVLVTGSLYLVGGLLTFLKADVS